MAYEMQNPDDIIVARAGALHEKLTKLVQHIQKQLKEGTLAIEDKDPEYVAANILFNLLHTGDGRIHTTSLTR